MISSLKQESKSYEYYTVKSGLLVSNDSMNEWEKTLMVGLRSSQGKLHPRKEATNTTDKGPMMLTAPWEKKKIVQW